MTDLAPHVSGFICEHMPLQRIASPRTMASYADSLTLLVYHVAECFEVRPSAITVEQLTADVVCDFLDHLEADLGNRTSTRNVRLDAALPRRLLHEYLDLRPGSVPMQARLSDREAA